MSTSSRLLVALGLAWIGLAAPCDAHVNDKLGFRITLPKEFELSRSSFDMDLPTLDDNYLVDVFKSSKEISVANDWFGYHRGVYTLWFPTRNAVDIAKKEQEDREKKEKEGAEKKPEIIIGGVDERIYNSFKEWAEGRVQGFYFGPDKAGKVAGFDAVIREMVFEKGRHLLGVQEIEQGFSFGGRGGLCRFLDVAQRNRSQYRLQIAHAWQMKGLGRDSVRLG